jgi:hypothetical protein
VQEAIPGPLLASAQEKLVAMSSPGVYVWPPAGEAITALGGPITMVIGWVWVEAFGLPELSLTVSETW